MKQTKSLLGIIAGIFAVAFVMASCETQVEPPATTTYTVTYTSEHGTVPEAITVEENTVLSEEQLPTCSYGGLVFKGWFDGDTKAVPGEYTVTDNVTLTARWASTATVSYHSKNGTVPESFDAELHQTLTAENLAPLTYSPYIFLGWYYGKDANNNGTGTIAKAGDAIEDDVSLYAKWDTITVSYHSKFGTAPESLVIEKNRGLASEMLSAPADCSPYVFDGWYSSKDGEDNGTGTKVQAGDKITDDVHLYAKWKKATVSFTTEYGTVPSITKYTGQKISETEIPTLAARTGYTLDGWFNGSTKLTTDYTVNDDVVFTEKWTVNTYLITFKANGGAESDSTQSVTYGSTVKLNANTFTRDGWSFIGWNKAADGSGTPYSDESNYAVTDANDITLYAQWDPNATASTVYGMIRGMTESGTIAVKGSISDDTISTIDRALYDLWQEKGSNVLVSLDLSRTTGITELKASAFMWRYQGLKNLKDITIPSSVTSIGSSAFEGCSGLTSITIPSSVTEIGDGAFEGCSSLTSITIPSGVTSIGSQVFNGCSSLTEITIPSGVTSIEFRAFYGCSSLTSITIPSSVTAIGEGAFRGCSSLTEITIPSSVTSIGNFAFSGCSSLTSITIPSKVTEIKNHTFYGCSSLTSITIPSGVTSIGSQVFDGCSSLTSITIPSSVTLIGDYTFNGCSSLTEITIPSSVTYIGYYAFSGCSSLTSITIPYKVTQIESHTFYGCSGLTSITIPSSVKRIREHAFSGCSKLTDVTFADTESSWDYYNGNTKEGTIGKMSATDTAGNATLLTLTYADYIWRKQQ